MVGVVGPAADVELVVVDVGAAQFRVVGPAWSTSRASTSRSSARRLEAAHAGAFEVDREVEAEGEAVAGRETSSRTVGAQGSGL